ncbi:hypothetical protein [Streptomyces sp. NPDC001914]|uniref:hypothetical protein n=1 Tax=Streptomyces sp. NPDC001914 TaxID=3364623 RepID=UPI003683FBE9
MDAGLAAVLGALAGSFATIGAALAAGWAQREGARISARSEHRRERREPRHDTYKEFMSVAATVRDVVAVYAIDTDLTPVEYANEETENRLREASFAVKDKWVDVSLAGPTSIAKMAYQIERASYLAILEFSGYRQCLADDDEKSQYARRVFRKNLLDVSRQLDVLLVNFVDAAQIALDDDGSRKR